MVDCTPIRVLQLVCWPMIPSHHWSTLPLGYVSSSHVHSAMSCIICPQLSMHGYSTCYNVYILCHYRYLLVFPITAHGLYCYCCPPTDCSQCCVCRHKNKKKVRKGEGEPELGRRLVCVSSMCFVRLITTV